MSRKYGFLQLFAADDGGVGGAAATGDAAAAAAAPAAGGVSTGAAPVTPAAGGAAEAELPANMQEAFNKRLGAERAKLERELRASLDTDLRKQYDSHIKLGEFFRQQGYDPNTVLSEWERQAQAERAQQAGLPPQVYSELENMRRQVTTLEQGQKLAGLNAEVKTLEADPGFAPVLAIHGQKALELAARSGQTLKQALYAIAGDEVVAATAAAKEQEVLARVTGRSDKGPVNATGGPGVTPENDVSKMPKDQFQKILKEVLRGDRTSL